MHLQYHDILSRIADPPKWWLDGVPRFDDFSPKGLLSSEVALVHSECQDCGVRYDIAVTPKPPLFHSLRTQLAYLNEFDIGDPPNACAEIKGGVRCAGYAMTVSELEILEFWSRRPGLKRDWLRIEALEKPLNGARWDDRFPGDVTKPIWEVINDSQDRVAWEEALSSGDQRGLTAILEAHKCKEPEAVAMMVDLDSRFQNYRNHLFTIRSGMGR